MVKYSEMAETFFRAETGSSEFLLSKNPFRHDIMSRILDTNMKTLSRARGILQSFFDVGPETKGFTVEIALAFLMFCSLALFLFFSIEKKEGLHGNIQNLQIENLEKSSL